MNIYLHVGINSLNDNSDEPYEAIFSLINFIHLQNFNNILFSKKLNLYSDLYKPVHFSTDNVITLKTKYKIILSIDKYNNKDIKYLKNVDPINTYPISLLLYVYEDIYKIVGFEYNENKYYYKYNSINDYTDINDLKNSVFSDKKFISESIFKSLMVYLKNRAIYDKYNNSVILNSYENFYKINHVINNVKDIQYINIYKSVMLKCHIYDKNTDCKNYCVFLPTDKDNKISNLFKYYQLLFYILEKGSKKNFTNPKNESYFGNDNRIVVTDYSLHIRLFTSKLNSLNSVMYRKSQEIKNYKVSLIVNNKNNKIIGLVFNDIKYYIWKQNGDLNTYTTYYNNKNYSDFVLNGFKDSIIFLFKHIYYNNS